MTTVLAKSLDQVNLITCILSDVYNSLGLSVPPRYQRLTIQKIANRFKREGQGFFTKQLPRLGKALDSALLGKDAFNCIGFRKEPDTQIPMLFGNLFRRVFDLDGKVLPTPCVDSIRALRQICYLFYKYKLPYDRKLEQSTVDKFVMAEQDVCEDVKFLNDAYLSDHDPRNALLYKVEREQLRRAQQLVHKLFCGFDVTGIVPRHGPGVVSTKEKYAQKYHFQRINPRAQMMFPFDKHMFINEDHLCDELHLVRNATIEESYAQVKLVPKDSRGPRVISCEPLENQWLQQGLMRSMVQWIERHPLTRNDVRFTDQSPNRMAALAGSLHGELATLDLKEASDRVSCWLVEQLFPEPVLSALLATRSVATKLPDGTVLELRKFAPMGSACCFPVLAICVWALLRSGVAGSDGKPVLVYGDDVIVETAYAEHAIEQLEAYGLHVNRDKSCTSGFFRESCGMDAYAGENVTPVRLRTVWSSTPAADHYEAWLAYANSFFCNGYRITSAFIAERLCAIYRDIPVREIWGKSEISRHSSDGSTIITIKDIPTPLHPALWFDAYASSTSRFRTNADIQQRQELVRVVRPKYVTIKSQSGWQSLMRYFTERCNMHDDTTAIILCRIMGSLAQKSRKSTTVINDCIAGSGVEGTPSYVPVEYLSDEIASLADEEVCSSNYHLDVASLSSLTGVAIPVVHECLRSYLIRQSSLRGVPVFPNGSTPKELNVYAMPKRTKLVRTWVPA